MESSGEIITKNSSSISQLDHNRNLSCNDVSEEQATDPRYEPWELLFNVKWNESALRKMEVLEFLSIELILEYIQTFQ